MTRNIQRTGSLLLAAICCLVLSVGAITPARGDEPAGANSNQPVSFWMKKKLDFSQQILAGITTGDFDKIVENGQAMRSLSKIEGFVRGQTPGYRTQLQIFEESADEIIRQAKNDNVEGATLAFTQLTISCVNCHKQLRAAK